MKITQDHIDVAAGLLRLFGKGKRSDALIELFAQRALVDELKTATERIETWRKATMDDIPMELPVLSRDEWLAVAEALRLSGKTYRQIRKLL